MDEKRLEAIIEAADKGYPDVVEPTVGERTTALAARMFIVLEAEGATVQEALYACTRVLPAMVKGLVTVGWSGGSQR